MGIDNNDHGVTPRDFIAEVCDELYRMDSPEWTRPVSIDMLVMRTSLILTSIKEMERHRSR